MNISAFCVNIQTASGKRDCWSISNSITQSFASCKIPNLYFLSNVLSCSPSLTKIIFVTFRIPLLNPHNGIYFPNVFLQYSPPLDTLTLFILLFLTLMSKWIYLLFVLIYKQLLGSATVGLYLIPSPNLLLHVKSRTYIFSATFWAAHPLWQK